MDFNPIKEKYHSHILDFEFCAGYIRQATRNLPNHLWRSESLIFSTFKERLSPDKVPVIVVAVGRDRSGGIITYAKSLSEQYHHNVVVKNVGLDLEDQLKEAGFEDYQEGESWDNYSKYDDNTFPQQVVNVEDCLSLFGPKYGQLRFELRKFDRRYKIRVEKTNSTSFNKLLHYWAKQMAEHTGIDQWHFIDSHQMFDPGCNDHFGYGIFDENSGKNIGYLSFTPISEICLGFNAILNDHNYLNSSRRFIFEGIKIAKNLGYHFINLQGSESYGQYKSKRFFRAEIEIPKKHLVYRFKP